MKYLIATFKINPNSELACDLLAAIAGEAGFETFEETENGLNGYVQEQLLNRELLDNGIKEFPLDGIDIAYTLAEAAHKDWNEAWEEEGFSPIVIDKKCIIYDAKHPTSVSQYTAHDILLIGIDAKMAFGTGTHETTQMMVSALLNMNLEGKRVLDCGCGTGILGIAASKNNASEITAYDIDEWSVENARHNAALNKVENIEVLLGDAHVLSHVSGVFDVVVANINRNILLQDMYAFKEVMAGNATLLISGFYEEDVQLLVEKASSLGLEYKSKSTSGDWCCLTFEAAT